MVMIDNLINSGHIKKIDGLYLRQNQYENSIVLTDNEFEDGRIKENIISIIKKLKINGLELNDFFGFSMFDLDFVSQIQWFESIKVIKSGGVNSKDLEQLPNIKRFVNNYTDEPINFLCFKKLIEVDILWSKGRENILHCENIETLTLHRLKLKNLQDFDKLNRLKNLSLINSSLESFEGIEKLESLEKLEIYHNRNLIDLSSLSKCKNLKWLKLENCSKMDSLKTIENCVNLEYISITDCKKVIDNKYIFLLKNLKTLAILRSGNIESISGVEKMQNLERFIIYDTNVIDGDLHPLLKLKKMNFCFFKDKKHYSLKLKEIKQKLEIK